MVADTNNTICDFLSSSQGQICNELVISEQEKGKKRIGDENLLIAVFNHVAISLENQHLHCVCDRTL